MQTQMLEKLKTNLRVDSGVFDEAELLPMIDACSKDLVNGGVSRTKAIDYEDALIQRAVVLYAKAHFGFDANADRFAKAYTSLKECLALAGDYNE